MVLGQLLNLPSLAVDKKATAPQDAKQPNKATSKTDSKTDTAVHEKLTQAEQVQKELTTLNEQRIVHNLKNQGVDPTSLAKKHLHIGKNGIQSNTPVSGTPPVMPRLQPAQKFVTTIQVGAEIFKIEAYFPHGTDSKDKDRFAEAFRNHVIPTIILKGEVNTKGSFTVSFSEDGNGFSTHADQSNGASVDFDLNSSDIKLPNGDYSKTEIRFIAQLLQSTLVVTPVLSAKEKANATQLRTLNDRPTEEVEEDPETGVGRGEIPPPPNSGIPLPPVTGPPKTNNNQAKTAWPTVITEGNGKTPAEEKKPRVDANSPSNRGALELQLKHRLAFQLKKQNEHEAQEAARNAQNK